MLKIECDRCGAQAGPIRIYGMPAMSSAYNGMANALAEQPAMFEKPPGWTSVYGKNLCKSCSGTVEAVLVTLPKVK